MVKAKEKSNEKREQRLYLNDLKRYKRNGVRIKVDGKECPEAEWYRIFEMEEDGLFYMGDYVGSEDGHLEEIRFDKVYFRDPPPKKEENGT